MKDLYSFSRTQAEHEAFYEKISDAYNRVFARLGISDDTYKTFASGGIFAKFSHEFQTISEAGEDTIYVHEGKKIAINKEVYTDEVLKDLEINKADLIEHTAVEVGNIFTLGTRFSEPLGLHFTDELGKQQTVIMGSYGMGPSRLMGLLAEKFADEKGLVWPESIAPAKVYIARLGNIPHVVSAADELYGDLTKSNIAVIYDDRDIRAGEKFADAELIGIPYRVVVSEKTITSGEFELKARTTDKTQLLSKQELIKILK